MNNKVRDDIFALELFDPGSESGHSINAMILHSDDISLLPQAALIDELDQMEIDGLLEKEGEYYRSTNLGKIAKQRNLARSGHRAAAIANQKNYALSDLILAIAVSKRISSGTTSGTFKRKVFYIYLYEFSTTEIEASIIDQINTGYLGISSFMLGDAIHVTGQGLHYYQREVRQRLGLTQNEGVLDIPSIALTDKRFSLLGLDEQLKTNVQLRWLEVETCANCGAYLAAVILLGSVLEGLLLARLQRDIKLAMTSPKAPREGNKTTAKKLKDWSLQDYIAVSADLGFVPRSVEKHIHELRDTRNLVHPNKQISSNIIADEPLYRISKEVAETIIDALQEAK